MIGKTISHYKIKEKLGEGGMGVVYKAEDTKLKRTVALKFLPPELTRNPEAKERFIREAQAAAGLEHSNICNIYEIDETEDGQLFIVMACYEGETLKDKIKDQRLNIKESINIATQIAQGLEKAHGQGIYHRDIKPANIIITTDGLVKILDFGLAKLVGQVQLTKDSSTLGTVAYMSPEQCSGGEVDHRTDIWSLGVVLYEILTGQLPFKGEYEQAIMYSILNDEPISLNKFRSDIPSNIEQLISKTLEKDRSNRYQNVQELIKDLETKPTVSTTPKEKSIIVLPFENMISDPEQEYFSDGLTEEIITDLSHIHDLLVISRNSAMSFKGSKNTTKEIAEKVNVQYVLEGSVRKAGNNIRITAQLIDAKTDSHLWAEKYNGTLDDVFDIQEKVSRSIVEALKIRLIPEEKQKIVARPIDNFQAYDFHIKAQNAMLSQTEEGIKKSLQYINNGLDIIGDNEILFADMGQAYMHYLEFGIDRDESTFRKAEQCVKKVFSLNPESADGHYLRGHLNRWKGHIKESIKNYKRAISIEPNHFYSSLYLSWLYAFSGKGCSARQIVQRLIKIDPLNMLSYMMTGAVNILDGQFNQAIDILRKGYELEPNPFIGWWLAKGLAYNNNLKEAYYLFERIGSEATETQWARLSQFFLYASQGEKSKALEVVTEELKKMMKGDELYPIWMAESYALIGQKEEAIEWIEEGVRSYNINYPFLNEYDPFLENIRGEERFKKIMEKVKHEWENFEV